MDQRVLLEVSCVLTLWVVPRISLGNGLEWAHLELLSLSLQVSSSFRSSFVLTNLGTVVIVDPIRPLFDPRAK